MSFAPPKFIVEADLFPLCRALRMLGFDALYRGNLASKEALQKAIEERRTWVCRGQEALHLQYGINYFVVESGGIAEQLKEIDLRYDLRSQQQPFIRCLKCNAVIHEVTAEQIRDRVPEKVAATFRQFFECPVCRRVYWYGSHLQRMKKMLEKWGWPIEGNDNGQTLSRSNP